MNSDERTRLDMRVTLVSNTESNVLSLLRKVHGEDAVTEPKPARWGQGVEAAKMAMDAANTLLNRWMRQARSDGVPWEELSDAIHPSAKVRDADTAYRLLAADVYQELDAPCVTWQCSTCHERITDYGPYDPDPTASEQGHADGCERHARETAEYERWNNA